MASAMAGVGSNALMAYPIAITRDDTDETPSKAPAGDLPAARSDEDIIHELRERRTYAQNAWAERRKEGAKDVLCVAGKVWEAMDPNGLRDRQAAVRPALAPDEIGQYLNQTGNDVRQNKRSIRATPIGNGANKQTAEFIQGRIRQIEYRSNAQREVYSPIFEDALQRSYGFGRFVASRVSDTSRNMEVRIESFPNPDVVLVDPDGAMLSPDCAKIQWAFILDASRTKKMFKREFDDDAEVVDFTDDHERVAPDWIKGDHVTVAEYWIVEQARRRVVFLKDNPSLGIFENKLPFKLEKKDARVDYEHWVDVPYVCQYLTNGIELLAKKGQNKRTPWPGKSIPLFSCFGKAIYTQSGAGTNCELMSMVRPMRQPAMYYSYIRTCQAEVVGGVTRTQWVGYEGQFRGHEDEWTKAAHEPVPYSVVKAKTEATGDEILPLPIKQNWDPPIQNLEVLAEGARRSVQTAAGGTPLSTDARRINEKSGKALDRIEASGQKGSYHFVDHLDGMITRVGQMAAELIPFYDDTKGEVTVRDATDQPRQQKINDPLDPQSVMVSPDHLHDITISIGSYEADEREASSDFADTIIQNAPLMQMVGPQKAAELIAEAIRLKAVGPIGDNMADIISPKPTDPGQPPTPQQLQQAQAQMQGLQQENQQLQQAAATEQAKQQATIDKAHIDAASRERIAQMNLDAKRMDNETKIAVAELGAKVDRLALFLEERARLGMQEQAVHDRAHDVGIAAMDHAHGLEAGAQVHNQALEASAQGSDQVMQQAEHAQEIQPPEPSAAGA